MQLTVVCQKKGLPGEQIVIAGQANGSSSGFCYCSCCTTEMMSLENDTTYVASTCWLQVILLFLVSEADADETSNINMQIEMVPNQRHSAYL